MWQEKKGSVEGRILWHLPDSHPDTQAMYNLLFGVYRTWIYDGCHSLKYRKGKRFLQMQLRLQNSKWVKRLSWMDQTYQMKTLKRMTGLGPLEREDSPSNWLWRSKMPWVLKVQGNEFCQQPGEIGTRPQASDDSAAHIDTLWNPEKLTQISGA